MTENFTMRHAWKVARMVLASSSTLVSVFDTADATTSMDDIDTAHSGGWINDRASGLHVLSEISAYGETTYAFTITDLGSD